MTYSLRLEGDPILLKQSTPVLKSEFGSIKLIDLVDNMTKIMQEHDGLGISAVQIGVPTQVMLVSSYETPVTLMINPKVITEYGSQTCKEGCLSFPGVVIKTERPTRMTVEYQDILGELTKLSSRDKLFVQCFFHELDHFSGKLIR